jgi:hypothetical protein
LGSLQFKTATTANVIEWMFPVVEEGGRFAASLSAGAELEGPEGTTCGEFAKLCENWLVQGKNYCERSLAFSHRESRLGSANLPTGDELDRWMQRAAMVGAVLGRNEPEFMKAWWNTMPDELREQPNPYVQA